MKLKSTFNVVLVAHTSKSSLHVQRNPYLIDVGHHIHLAV